MLRTRSPIRAVGWLLLGLSMWTGRYVHAQIGTRQDPGRAVFNPLRLDEVAWTEGFWAQRFEAVREKMIPAMWEIMRGTDYKPFLEHFRIAAGLAGGRHRGAKWNDGDFYKWMEAVAASLSVRWDSEWDQRLDEAIDLIARAQREDGYIHTPVLIAARQGDQDARPLNDRFDFEMYNHGHLMTAGALHYEVTGKRALLDVACRAADYVASVFLEPTQEQMRHAVCPSHYMGLIDLYRATGERGYLELAERLIRMRDLVDGGGDDNQDRLRFVDHNEAVGHAVRANYLFAGVADLCLEIDDGAYWGSLERLWENVVGKKMYITGACGALYDGASPDGSADQGVITRVHQAYGRNYQLPNETAHGETCANIGNALWNWRMALASGDARYIDVLELSLYNAILCGVGLNGRDFFYTNPLRVWDEPSVDLRWSRTRVPFVTSFCCPPNLLRTLAAAHGWVYGRSDDALWVHLYGGSEVNTTLDSGENVGLRQTTDYPWDGEIVLTMTQVPTVPFALRLRIPGWATGARAFVNGEAVSLDLEPGSYFPLRRQWVVGDEVRLSLPMAAQWMEAHPLVEETRRQVALKRGPLVYCLESVDLPRGVSLAQVGVQANAAIRAHWDAEHLGGVTILETPLIVRDSVVWGQSLYRPLRLGEVQTIEGRLTPYYAWGNRGAGEMSVWLPLDGKR